VALGEKAAGVELPIGRTVVAPAPDLVERLSLHDLPDPGLGRASAPLVAGDERLREALLDDVAGSVPIFEKSGGSDHEAGLPSLVDAPDLFDRKCHRWRDVPVSSLALVLARKRRPLVAGARSKAVAFSRSS
jgi:hypothetical protein